MHRRRTHCRNVYATLPTALLFRPLWQHSSSPSRPYCTQQALARVRYINPRSTLHYITYDLDFQFPSSYSHHHHHHHHHFICSIIQQYATFSRIRFQKSRTARSDKNTNSCGMTKYRKGPQRTTKDPQKTHKGPQRSITG